MMRLVKLIIVMSLLVLIFGCDDDQVVSAPPSTAKKVKPSKPVAQKEQAKREVPKPVFKYSPIGKRDPFESLLRKEKDAKESEVPKTPLEKFDLGQFRVQAILIGKGAPRAMVSAPDGKNYILKPGLKIGKNNGVVKGITKAAILVEEATYDYLGNEIKGLQSITIPEQESF